MLLQTVSVPLRPGQEPGLAVGTGEGGWTPRMFNVTVRRQLTGPAEGGRAVGAAQGFGLGVQQGVLPQIGRLREAALADVAAIRSHAGVDEVVPHQIGQRRERLAAVRTLEGPLARVRADVVAHVDALLEGLAAQAAHELALGAVRLVPMVDQLQLGSEALAA